MSLDIVPVSLKEANAFVERYHRHHRSVVGHKFSIGETDGEKIVGIWKCHRKRPRQSRAYERKLT